MHIHQKLINALTNREFGFLVKNQQEEAAKITSEGELPTSHFEELLKDRKVEIEKRVTILVLSKEVFSCFKNVFLGLSNPSLDVSFHLRNGLKLHQETTEKYKEYKSQYTADPFVDTAMAKIDKACGIILNKVSKAAFS